MLDSGQNVNFSSKDMQYLTRDELHKASVTDRFVALRNATVRYQKALRSTL